MNIHWILSRSSTNQIIFQIILFSFSALFVETMNMEKDRIDRTNMNESLLTIFSFLNAYSYDGNYLIEQTSTMQT